MAPTYTNPLLGKASPTLVGLGVRLPVLDADEGQAHQPILADVGVVDLGDEFQSGRL